MTAITIATLKNTIRTPRGVMSSDSTVATGVTPADTAASRLKGVGQMAREANRQAGGERYSKIKGDPARISDGKGLSKEDRKAISSSESGPVLIHSFYHSPGYIIPTANLSEGSLKRGIEFLETYRSDRTRSVKEKDNYPIASIQVLSRNSGGRLATGKSSVKTILPSYTRFMLQQAHMPTSEKYQLARTFRSFRLFLFGSNPQVWQFSGTLLNTENQNWASEFRSVYNSHLRGTRCAKIGAEVYMTFNDIAISGIMINTSSSLNSNEPNSVPFSFSIIVTNDAFISGSPIMNLSQRMTYPLGAKNQPALVFEVMRNSYARKYGEKETRSGSTKITASRAAKLGLNSEKAKKARLTTPSKRN